MVHEWALAESIVNYLSLELPGKKAEKVVIGLGRLQSIEQDILDFALRELLVQADIHVEEITYVIIEPKLRCRACGYEWKLLPEELNEEIAEMIHFVPEAIHSFLTCPRCGSRDFEIEEGRGITIVEVIK
ncbi:MAG: hydrogenase nickel incorporation protein HypA [Thermoprotei archaeon]|nr:hydrogenase nickel incorporation protein HypA [Thermoprotei archaeon]